jgi:hypothetical protein
MRVDVAEKVETGGSEDGAETPARKDAEDPSISDEPSSEDDALARLRGESSSRQDMARAFEIISRRLRIIEEADVRVGTVNMFNGPVDVGGDFTTGGGRRARHVGIDRVPTSHVADYTIAYVRPAGYENALATLQTNNLLVLVLGHGTGRDAVTYALLTNLLGKDAELSALPAFDATWSVPEKDGQAYLVADAEVGKLDDAWLSRISERLCANKSYLVLCTTQLGGSLAEATRRAEFVVDTLRAPDPVLVVRARLLHAAVVAESDVDGLLSDWDVEAVLAERPRPRFAVQVAAAIVEALAAGRNVRAALDRLNDPVSQVDEWFTDHEKPEQIAFAVAAAVLEESTYLTLSDAAVRLYEALAPRQISPPPLRFRQRMAAEQPWLELTPGTPAVVRFRSPQMQSVVLDYAWHELDGMRPALEEWLLDMAAHVDVEVRARAAAAAGMLALQDFQHTLQRFLRPWASSTSYVLRHSAAIALSVIGQAPTHTERVWTLLRQWTSDVHSAAGKRLAATAGGAAGGLLGTAEPVRALRLLRDLAEIDDWALLQPVVLSVCQLVGTGSSAQVLDALLDWTDSDRDSELVVKGLTAFAFTAREQAFASTDDEENTSDWPHLLVETGMRTGLSAQFSTLGELWGRALSSRPARGLALEGLREWVRSVDRNPAAYPALLALLSDIADRGDRDFERLHYHLDRWESDAEDPSSTAGLLRDALTEPS